MGFSDEIKWQNIIDDVMAIEIAIQIKSGAGKEDDFGYAALSKARPLLAQSLDELRNNLSVKKAAKVDARPAYLRKWVEKDGRLGYGPATSECYLAEWKRGMCLPRHRGKA